MAALQFSILGLRSSRENGKENGNYRIIGSLLGLYRGVYTGYVGFRVLVVEIRV